MIPYSLVVERKNTELITQEYVYSVEDGISSCAGQKEVSKASVALFYKTKTKQFCM